MPNSQRASGCDLEFDAPIFINGNRAIKTALTCNARRISRDVILSSLVAYADSLNNDQTPQALVGSLDLGTSEIVEVADRVTLVVDLSQVEIPANCLFHTILYDFGRTVQMKGAKLVGAHDAMNFENTIQFRFEGE